VLLELMARMSRWVPVMNGWRKDLFKRGTLQGQILEDDDEIEGIRWSSVAHLKRRYNERLWWCEKDGTHRPELLRGARE
jgi:hypothetical protein